jgi:hypothetical protein
VEKEQEKKGQKGSKTKSKIKIRVGGRRNNRYDGRRRRRKWERRLIMHTRSEKGDINTDKGVRICRSRKGQNKKEDGTEKENKLAKMG